MSPRDIIPVTGLLAATRARLRARPDSEHQMALNRILLGVLMIAYLELAMAAPRGIEFLVGYCLLGLLVLGLLLIDLGVDHARRGVMMAIDIAIVSWILHVNGEYGAACYPIYLWVVFGNGFRLGLRYLYASGALGILGFALVVLFTPFWRDLPALSGSLLFGLATLPLYAGTLIRKLNNARKDAEAASRAKSYFLASVSHELRTPLTAIIGLSEHIADAGAATEDREMAGTIVSAGRGLLSLINQLLDFSRLEAGGVAINRRPFDLLPLLSEVRGLMRHTAHEKGLSLSLHVRPGTPLRMEGDDERLRDILINLLGNALKFTTAGSITIVADSVVTSGATLLRLAVADTGIGIAPEAQARIFGSFVQADDSIIDRFGGTGLGLAICRQLAERLGGRIWVESAPGIGSRFIFTATVTPLPAEQIELDRVLLIGAAGERAAEIRAALPETVAIDRVTDADEAMRAIEAFPRARIALFADAADGSPPALQDTLFRAHPPVLLCAADAWFDPATERAAITALPPDAAASDIRAALAIALGQSQRPAGEPSTDVIRPASPPARPPVRRVLVADDNPMNRKVFGMVLGRAGQEVELVENGEQALDRMKGHGFDIVLMDVNMPVMNGVEATKLYRFAALGHKRVPIIAVTADMSEENVARCLEAGMDACIGKPIDSDELIALIARLTADAAPTAPMVVPAFDPSATVVPLFAPAEAEPHDDPVLAPAALAELLDLGGEEFVNELLGVYREDAASMGARVRRAVETGDVKEFRDGTHALRSSAANIGATKLAEICKHYQRIAPPEFEARAAQHLATLEAELGRVARVLDARAGHTGRAARG